ncbi:ribonuclease R [Chromobacterium violaceum]|uniref:ribonuclease R n=1 Tax=Chromobacterium violaceum TaxID=536 RepID=UPI0015F9EA8A|nr:ribonuclease R [Chromobacterium violaceum]MBA8734424.1 ribonuclease R [Chromobacterium violaceum]
MAQTSKKQKNSSLREQDPFLDREKLKYSNPLPSREFIMQILAEQGVPLFPDELAHMLSIRRDEHAFFERRLRAMERDGEIIINRKGAVCVAQKLDLIRCKVSGHRDGYGFAMPDEGEGTGTDIFLPEREMKKVMHGDRVMVRPSGVDRRGRQEGKIVEVLEHAVSKLVGRIQHERGVWVVRPEDRRINHDILVEPGGDAGAKDGQVVMVDILQQPDAYHQPVGRVAEVLGNYADPGMEIEIALRKHALPHRFPDDALAQAKATPKKVRKKDWTKDRVDLRDLPLVTIDGETARDFDDAVYAEKLGKGYRLVVAIADVSFYVQPGDALDKEALDRGTSVYFPRRVIPMLPEALSNGICSLNPDVERMCMVCDMQINAKGEVKKYKFYPAVMQSKARLTYNQVWDWLQNGTDHAMLPHVKDLYALFKILLAARSKRGAIEFDSVETQMIFNDQGKIERIVPIVRNDAHRLIEECMLAANVCSADFLQKNGHKALYRVHEGPTEEKLENLRTYLRLVGLTLGGGDKPTAKDYGKLAEQIHGRPDAPVLQTMLLRSMQQAVYTPDNNGHFGLAYEAYTHFTSPIRRYPDLLVHRAIKAVLKGVKYKPGKWAQLGVHCSMTERRADDASRDVESWLKTYYMRDKVGEVFQGKISAVTSFGVFVLLDDVYAEGLVHISELGKDYFHFKKDVQAIIGEKSGIQYRLGDALTVKVMGANLESSQVDFALVRDEPSAQAAVGAGAEQAAPAKAGRRRRGKAGGAGDARAQPSEAIPAPDAVKAEPAISKPAGLPPAPKGRSRPTKPVTEQKPVAKTPTRQVAKPAEVRESARKPDSRSGAAAQAPASAAKPVAAKGRSPSAKPTAEAKPASQPVVAQPAATKPVPASGDATAPAAGTARGRSARRGRQEAAATQAPEAKQAAVRGQAAKPPAVAPQAEPKARPQAASRKRGSAKRGPDEA